MAANTTNFASVSLKNVYVLTVTIVCKYGHDKLMWYFLVRKKDERTYNDLFSNKEFHWLEGSKLVFGILGEYDNYCDIHFEKITYICDFSNRFKGMDMESYATLYEFINYINIMRNMVKDNSDVTFEF